MEVVRCRTDETLDRTEGFDLRTSFAAFVGKSGPASVVGTVCAAGCARVGFEGRESLAVVEDEMVLDRFGSRSNDLACLGIRLDILRFSAPCVLGDQDEKGACRLSTG